MAARRAVVFALVATGACGNFGGGGHDAAIDAGYDPDACVGLECFQFDCSKKGAPPTSISGTVYAPNGTLPLYGVDVYVPRSDPGPLPDGAQCARCDQGLLGGSFAQTRTDEAGNFKLENVPATTNVPLVIQTGKWRRQLVIPNVAACEDLPLPMTDTRLPKDRSEGDMPLIAITTGLADALECLPLKLGIARTEITTPAAGGRIQLFANAVGGQGANTFQAGWPGGVGAFGNAQMLWSTENNLKAYDIVMLSCEGNQYPASKPTTSLNAMKAYADLGGRVFASHWHNIWIEGGVGAEAPPEWVSVATWNNSGTTFNSPPVGTDGPDFIDEVSNPKGMAFATWMMNVMGSTVRGQIPITNGKQTATAVDPAKAERWVYWVNAANQTFPQNFQFTTPNELPSDQRCGKVVFSDMHVSSGSTSSPGTPYPGGCNMGPLTPQEKALAFMFFDIASCVGTLF
ncbi:MAG TPA: hypothetical protein VIV11_23465 [Kofleriaceae bacterium]